MSDGSCKVTKNGKKLPLRLNVQNHSPTGFEWGYSGSGPAQLALAILCCEYQPDLAIALHQDFKRDVIANLERETWIIRSADVDQWFNDRLEKKRVEMETQKTLFDFIQEENGN